MKLLFSEQNSDYEHYQFPYAIWAVPEAGETPSDIFNAGFLPSSRNLDRFYLCRQVRVNLAKFKPSSENRRILRKGAGIEVKLVPRDKYNYTPERREFFKTYADIKFGKDVMTFERLDALFGSPIISHLLVFTDAKTGSGSRRGDALPRGPGTRVLLLRVLRPELLRAQPRHVHDDLGGGVVRRTRLQASLPRHVLFANGAV